MICPCGSSKPYSECCEPYHKGTPTPSPLALMRSRYSAYALNNPDYIMKTTHPKSPYFEKDRKRWKSAIQEFSRSTTFDKLEILDSKDNWVHFDAYLTQGEPFILEEKSLFEKVDGAWLYLTGTIKKKLRL